MPLASTLTSYLTGKPAGTACAAEEQGGDPEALPGLVVEKASDCHHPRSRQKARVCVLPGRGGEKAEEKINMSSLHGSVRLHKVALDQTTIWF